MAQRAMLFPIPGLGDISEVEGRLHGADTQFNVGFTNEKALKLCNTRVFVRLLAFDHEEEVPSAP